MVNRRHNKQGSLMIEMVLALSIIITVLIPLGYSFMEEQHVLRVYYWRAVAMEAIDGEMEVLAAGDWHTYGEGEHPYTVHAESAKYLPPGSFTLTVRGPQLRLEWQPEKPRSALPVVREAVGR